MSKEEQSVYFTMAEQLRHIHKLNNPNWSNQLNYVSIRTLVIHRLNKEQSQNKCLVSFV